MNNFIKNRKNKNNISKNRNKFLSVLLSRDFLIGIYIVLLSIFLLAPIIIVVISSFSGESYFVFPPRSFSLRWYINFFNSTEFMGAFKISLILGFTVVILTLFVGTLASVALVRFNFPGKKIVHSFFLWPLMLPSIILAISLLIFYSRIRILGSFSGLVCAHMLLTTPFVLRAIMGCLYTISWSIDEAAQNLGANRLQSFFYVILPQIKFGLITATIFAFIISFDEVVVSLFTVGALTKTLPVYIFNYLEYTTDPTIAAIATIFITIIATILIFIPKKYLATIGTR